MEGVAVDNCKSEKLRELVLETIGLFPHQYSYQARYMKEQAEIRFGNWWSAVIIGDRGGYGMSAIYDQYANTRWVPYHFIYHHFTLAQCTFVQVRKPLLYKTHITTLQNIPEKLLFYKTLLP